jgi:hypothetical protein
MTDQEITSDKLFEIVFSELPLDPLSIGILPYIEDDNVSLNDHDAMTFVFELLINIYMQAMMDIHRLSYMLANNQVVDYNSVNREKLDVYLVNSEILEIPKKWFMSFGYNIKIREFDSEEDVPNYYCKILLKDNPEDLGYFYAKQLNCDFQFVLNSQYKTANRLEEINALFIKPKQKGNIEDTKKYYLISFKLFQFN